MKIFISVLVLIFGLQPWTKANEISEFQIEGISVGDSLLKFVTKEKIENIKNKYDVFIYDDKTFYSITIFEGMELEKYDFLQFHLKANDKNYKIYSLGGRINFKDKINECYKLMDDIVNEFKSIFNNYDLNDAGIKDLKNQDGSIAKVKSAFLNLSNGDVASVHCYDHPPDFNITDNLAIYIYNNEYSIWLETKAYSKRYN